MMKLTNSQRWWRLLIGAALCAAFWGLPAREAVAAPSCSATMTGLNFGDVDLVTGGTLTASATLNYTCTNDNSNARYARLCFNIGDGSASQASAGGHWDPRILRDGSTNEMNVQFYQGATSVIWGSTTQPIPDAYDVTLTLPQRVNGFTPSVTTGSATLRGVISTGQAALPPGLYQSSFTGNHTAFRYGIANSSGAVPGDCASVGTSGGTFGFNASANVVKSCLVSADPLDFGTVDGIASSTNIDSTTTIRVICSKPTAYNVLLIPSNGNTGGSSAMKGQATGNTDTVPYRLYSNAARSAPWGSLAANDVSGTGDGLTQSLAVYGRVPGLPNVQPDSYKDVVTVNVTY